MDHARKQDLQPDSTDWAESRRSMPGEAGWMLLANLSLGCVFFLELQWYLQNIYRFAPWIPLLSFDQIDTVVDVLWGAFMLHVGAPLARGKLEILIHPEKFLGKEAMGVFSHRGTAVLGAAFVAAVYALIGFSPALHLIRNAEDEAPLVEVNGTRRQFQGTSLPLLDEEMRLDATEIVVTGRHGLYRVRLQPQDVKRYKLFPTHLRADLRRLVLRRDMVTTFLDADDRELSSFTFYYQHNLGIAEQCGASGFGQSFGDDASACGTLVRSIMEDMAGRPDARLLNDCEGAVDFKGRIYRYSYAFGPELSLAIRAPEGQSEFANTPLEALNRYTRRLPRGRRRS